MVVPTKELVLDWYQGLSAPHRLELMCALLDHSLPFELRFLGSVIENLGRKDFHILRDAEIKANSLHSALESQDVAGILKVLAEGHAPPNIAMSSQQQLQQQQNPIHQTGATHSHSTTGVAESRGGAPPAFRGKSSSELGNVVENGLSSSKSSSPNCSQTSEKSREGQGHDRVGGGGGSVSVEDGNSEEEGEPKKDLWLYDGVKRRKLILYLSLMSATNRDSANLYYLLLSDVEDSLEGLEWLEDMEECVQDEIFVMYTIGSHHPAFNFDQRTFLAGVLNRIRTHRPPNPVPVAYPMAYRPAIFMQNPNPGPYMHARYPEVPRGPIRNISGNIVGMAPPMPPPAGFRTGGVRVCGPGPLLSQIPINQLNIRPATLDNSVIPGIEETVPVVCHPKKISCYNCGSNQHIGPECKQMSMEEMTKLQYRLNYGGDATEGE